MFLKIFLAAPNAYVDWVKELEQELVAANLKDEEHQVFISSTWHSRNVTKYDDTNSGRTQAALRNEMEMATTDVVFSFGLPDDKGDTSYRGSLVGLGLGKTKTIIHYGYKTTSVDYGPNIVCPSTVPLMKDRTTPESPEIFATVVRDQVRELIQNAIRNSANSQNSGGISPANPGAAR